MRKEGLIGQISRGAGFGLMEVMSRWGYSIKVEGKENLLALNNKNHLPLIIYFNHSALVDPAVILLLTRHHLKGRLDGPVFYPVAASYLRSDFQANQLPIYRKAVSVAEKMGFIMTPILQSYRLRDERLTELEKKALEDTNRQLSQEFIRTADRLLPLHPTIIIAPEGHRSENSYLQPAELGLGWLVKKLQRLKKNETIFGARLLPVGLTYQGDCREEINLNPLERRQVNIKIGSPLSLSQIDTELSEFVNRINYHGDNSRVMTDFLMTQLCPLIPEANWGVYHPDLLVDTLAGRFELRMHPQQNKAGVYDKRDNLFI